MFRNYFKTALRHLFKNKLYSLINIFGLALGISACFFIFQYVHYESNYDRFNKNADNIYRVTLKFSGSFANVLPSATNHPAVGPAMKRDFPEVKNFARLVSSSVFVGSNTTVSNKENPGSPKVFSERRLYVADSSIFEMFSFPFMAGDPRTALTQGNSMVISESSAAKYFGKENPIGKTLEMNGLTLKVTGVFKDVPENSHLKFDMLVSFTTFPPEMGLDQNWAWPEYYNYVQLTPGANTKSIEQRFPSFIQKYLGEKMKELNYGASFQLQPLTDIHLKSSLLKEAEVNGSSKEVSFLSIIGIFILVIAWINYINLSTAKSMERAKEVGLRKVVGARRPQLIRQFLFESFLINLLALVLAIAIIYLAGPLFSRFTGKDLVKGFFNSGLGHNPSFWFAAVGIFLGATLLVGFYPAFALSSFRPVLVLKGVINIPNSKISLRRVLVSFQFVLSILLIASTLIVSRQLHFMKNQELGYKKDQLLVVKAPGVIDSTVFDKYRYFRTEITKNPQINEMSASAEIPGKSIESRNSVRRAETDKTHNFTTYLAEVDNNFFNTFDVRILAGRGFGEADSSNAHVAKDNRVVINEEVVQALGFKNNQEAINKRLVFILGTDEVNCEIIGVASNYHQRSLKEKYDPILYYFPSQTVWQYFTFHVNKQDARHGLAAIQSLFKTSFAGNPFEYFFLDDYFNRQYQSDQRLGNVFGLFAVLAIIVACLGLLGLSSFVIKLRTKEIGIRKVLGAPVSSILMLFSTDFVKLVCIASVIAIPLIYIGAHQWLMNYAFHIKLSWFIFLLPPLILLIIALLTISVQSLRAALSNPVKSLRSE